MEYILETKPGKDWQKHLNQWKRKYRIEVLKMEASIVREGVLVTLLVKRVPKIKTEEDE